MLQEEFDHATGMSFEDPEEAEDGKPAQNTGGGHKQHGKGQKKGLKRYKKSQAKKASLGQRKGGKPKQRPKR